MIHTSDTRSGSCQSLQTRSELITSFFQRGRVIWMHESGDHRKLAPVCCNRITANHRINKPLAVKFLNHNVVSFLLQFPFFRFPFLVFTPRCFPRADISSKRAFQTLLRLFWRLFFKDGVCERWRVWVKDEGLYVVKSLWTDLSTRTHFLFSCSFHGFVWFLRFKLITSFEATTSWQQSWLWPRRIYWRSRGWTGENSSS